MMALRLNSLAPSIILLSASIWLMVVLPFLNPFWLILSLQSISGLILFRIILLQVLSTIDPNAIPQQFPPLLRSPAFGVGTKFDIDHCSGLSLFIKAVLQKFRMRSSILHHLRILGLILSSPQPFPSLIDFFALVYSSDVNGPVLMFKSVKTGSMSSV